MKSAIRTRVSGAVVLLSLVPVLYAAQIASPSDPLAAYGWLRELAGHCWRGEQADGSVADTQCYEVQFGRHLRGTIEIPGAVGDAPKLRGDSVWSWDPARQKITVATWSTVAPVSLLDATLEDDRVRFVFSPTVRSRWQRLGPDAFVVTRERRDGEQWRDELRVTYRRVSRR